MTTAGEETPLLATPSEAAHERRLQKRAISALVSCSALIPLFAGGSFIPSVPEIARELNSTPPVISLAVSVSVASSAIGSMVFATYSGFYGRRAVYLLGLPLLCLGSLGVGASTTVLQLFFCRFVQAFGCSMGMSVGGGVIADIYKLTERGTAMGIFLAATLLGNALAPIIGGWATHYGSWRYLQFGLFAYGLVLFLAMLVYLPDTSHPGTTGLEKIARAEDPDASPRFRWVWLNPFACLALLRSPNLDFVVYSSGAVLLTEFGLQIPMAYTIGARYGITNEALIGACFIPMGLGNMVGAPLAGYLSDRTLVKWRARRGGVWVAEDRLRAATLPAVTLVPLSIIASALLTTYVAGPPGLVLNLFVLFLNGIGVDMVWSPLASYSVDILHSRSAEVMAASAGLRALFVTGVVAGVLPSIEHFGLIATDVGIACLAWSGFLAMWLVIRYGDRMRAWVDVGYSTAATN